MMNLMFLMRLKRAGPLGTQFYATLTWAQVEAVNSILKCLQETRLYLVKSASEYKRLLKVGNFYQRVSFVVEYKFNRWTDLHHQGLKTRLKENMGNVSQLN